MSNPQPPLDRDAKRRLAVIRHVEDVTGNVAMTCRYFGISRQAYYIWYRRYQAEGIDLLDVQQSRPAVNVLTRRLLGPRIDVVVGTDQLIGINQSLGLHVEEEGDGVFVAPLSKQASGLPKDPVVIGVLFMHPLVHARILPDKRLESHASSRSAP
jgi:hypothetical protein